ncbi:hypothetical protein IJD15_05870 [bacterium]|nr:hypothetical protein [bacterium]
MMNNISFKGYDAAPLKRIYLEGNTCSPFQKEMQKVGRQEKIEITPIPSRRRWIQDMKTVIEKDNKPFMLADTCPDPAFFEPLKLNLGINNVGTHHFQEGGNSFIGKYPNGEKWMIIGKDGEKYANKTAISEAYGIKQQNIHFIPQQDYHLDLTMRPIGYPYILVDDPELTKQHLKTLEKEFDSTEFQYMKENLEKGTLGYRGMYDSCDTVVKSLEKLGFKPIRIAGVYSNEINFMNAIVNKHNDGKISYITNSSKCDSPLKSRIQELFNEDLKKAVPNLDKAYFIAGESPDGNKNINHLMDILGRHAGGLHCMTIEEPNFKIWA